jgi:hypothetical protein
MDGIVADARAYAGEVAPGLVVEAATEGMAFVL